jgi:hypothetical protein
VQLLLVQRWVMGWVMDWAQMALQSPQALEPGWQQLLLLLLLLG